MVKRSYVPYSGFKRSAVCLLGILLVLATLLVRVLYIQTVDFDIYLGRVLDQMTTQSPTRAERGKIYDRYGRVLATSVTTYRIFISPSAIATSQRKADRKGLDVSYAEHISKELSEILGLEYEVVLKHTTYTGYLDRTVASGVSDEIADGVREFIEKYSYHDMVFVEAGYSRYYPNGTLASSVIGFTSADGKGAWGLEAYYDESLTGEDGYYVTARDSFGNELPYEYDTYVPSTSGADLQTTLDAYIQSALEEQLLAAVGESEAANRACGIVVNVKTGAVLAMATVPGYDLNDPRTLNEYYLNLLEHDGYDKDSEEYGKAYAAYLLEMWRNKAVSDSYIPGSTFKIITSSMALSDGKVNLLGDHVYCGGSLSVSGHTIHCHKTKGHGSLTFAEGLTQSCNVWFMTLGERIGISSFYDHLDDFGYLEKTGIDLPGESTSIIKSERAMTSLDLAIYAFGQNFNVTPIQHIMAVAAVANGGYLLEPYIVEEITDASGETVYKHEAAVKRQVVRSDICKTLADILEGGVAGEGGAKNAYVAGYKIAAKTGTSEKKGTDFRVEGVEPYVCSCVAFAPSDDPEIAVLIMVDEPIRGVLYGSTVAAPYVGALLENILPYIGEERNAELVNEISVPDLVGMSADAASAAARDCGFDLNIKGEGDTITSQTPAADTVIDATNKRITLYLGDTSPTGSCRVPNLLGMSAYEANRALVNAGFNVRIVGATNGNIGAGATVIEQSHPENALLPEGEVITVRLRYLEPDE